MFCGSDGERIHFDDEEAEWKGIKLREEYISKLNRIPAGIIFNQGLARHNDEGVSEVQDLEELEKHYNSLNGLDIDSLKEQMYPTIWVAGTDKQSAQQLQEGVTLGGIWDLQRDRTADGNTTPSAGLLQSNMNYISGLKDQIERIETTMSKRLDVPAIDIESMSGTITSGKALKAVYWNLITRCKEKFLTWEPQIKNICSIIIDGIYQYPASLEKYNLDDLSVLDFDIKYKILVTQNFPIPEDEDEEKARATVEVDTELRSRKSYMMEYRNLSSREANEEIIQIALEKNIIDNTGAIEAQGQSDNELIEMVRTTFAQVTESEEEEI